MAVFGSLGCGPPPTAWCPRHLSHYLGFPESVAWRVTNQLFWTNLCSSSMNAERQFWFSLKHQRMTISQLLLTAKEGKKSEDIIFLFPKGVSSSVKIRKPPRGKPLHAWGLSWVGSRHCHQSTSFLQMWPGRLEYHASFLKSNHTRIHVVKRSLVVNLLLNTIFTMNKGKPR